MLRFNNRNTRARCKICSNLTIKIPEQRQCCRTGAFIVNFEHISHPVLVFLLLTLGRFNTFSACSERERERKRESERDATLPSNLKQIFTLNEMFNSTFKMWFSSNFTDFYPALFSVTKSSL